MPFSSYDNVCANRNQVNNPYYVWFYLGRSVFYIV